MLDPHEALEQRPLTWAEARTVRHGESLGPHRHAANWPGVNTAPPQIEGSADALLTKGRAAAAKDFDDSAALDVRTSRWGIAGSEFLKLVAFLTAYRAAIGGREAIARDWQTFVGLVPDDLEGSVSTSGLRAEIAATLAGSLVTDETRLNAIKASVENVDKRMAQIVPLAEMLERMRMLAPDDDGFQAAIKALWLRLATLESGQLGEITQIQTDALALRLAKLKSLASRDEGRADLLEESASSVPVITSSRDSLRGPPDVAPLNPSGLRDVLRAWNWLFFAILLPVVVLVALSALYFGKPAFGTPADYASIFVWGFVGTTGGTLIKAAAGSFGSILPRR